MTIKILKINLEYGIRDHCSGFASGIRPFGSAAKRSSGNRRSCRHPVKYYLRRFLATLIDSLILGTVSFFINLVPSIVLGLSSAPVVPGQNGTLAISPVALIVSSIVSLAILAIELGYFIFFIGSRGQTLGKMAMGIRVVKIGTNEAPGYGKAFLREVVGKFVSSLVLFLGYFWMLWDSKKQTWHDKIAGTVVIKTS